MGSPWMGRGGTGRAKRCGQISRNAPGPQVKCQGFVAEHRIARKVAWTAPEKRTLSAQCETRNASIATIFTLSLSISATRAALPIASAWKQQSQQRPVDLPRQGRKHRGLRRDQGQWLPMLDEARARNCQEVSRVFNKHPVPFGSPCAGVA